MAIDRAALAMGCIRLASGVSFLIDPVRANRLWGDPDEPAPTTRLLLRSMGYRDALIGGLLTAAALRGNDTRGWFLASAGADGADLLGGVGVLGGSTWLTYAVSEPSRINSLSVNVNGGAFANIWRVRWPAGLAFIPLSLMVSPGLMSLSCLIHTGCASTRKNVCVPLLSQIISV